jgi:hypothetical protein
MSAERNLLFAVLAWQADCVNREQFIYVCTTQGDFYKAAGNILGATP